MLKNFLIAGALAAGLATAPAAASDWKPEKPVTLMVMFPPGGGGDVFARAVANHFETKMGWKLVVDNRPGGGGAAMAKALKGMPADGHAIGMAVTETYGFGPTLNPRIGFSNADFRHLGALANTQIGWIAAANAPWNDLKELVEASKNGPAITVGVFSPRSNAAIRAVAKHFGANFRPVPVKGGRAGMNNVMNGQLDTSLVAGPQAPFVRSGDVKVLASAERERLLVGSDALTFKEYGVGFASFNIKWMFSAPAGLPDGIAASWTEALRGATRDGAIRAFIEDKMSLKMEFTDGEALRRQIDSEDEVNANLIRFLK